MDGVAHCSQVRGTATFGGLSWKIWIMKETDLRCWMWLEYVLYIQADTASYIRLAAPKCSASQQAKKSGRAAAAGSWWTSSWGTPPHTQKESRKKNLRMNGPPAGGLTI